MERRRLIQTSPLDQRLEEQAKRLRKEAQGTPPGVERDKLIRRARQAETAAHIQQWLSSPGLQPPTWSVCGKRR
jgi:predicted trehalose synthase